MHALELSNMISEKMKKLTELKNDYTKVLEDNCRIRLPADIESLAEEYAEAYRNANANESRLQEQMKIPPKYDFGEPKDSFDARKEQHAKTIGSALNVVHATQKNLKDIDANLKSSFEAAKPVPCGVRTLITHTRGATSNTNNTSVAECPTRMRAGHREARWRRHRGGNARGSIDQCENDAPGGIDDSPDAFKHVSAASGRRWTAPGDRKSHSRNHSRNFSLDRREGCGAGGCKPSVKLC
eukprot:5079600-Prymnesium_polylepis.1